MISLFFYVVIGVCFGVTHGGLIEVKDCFIKCPLKPAEERYCCINEKGEEYCCPLLEFAAIYLIITVVVLIVLSIITSLVCCLCCPCCFFYKRRHSGSKGVLFNSALQSMFQRPSGYYNL